MNDNITSIFFDILKQNQKKEKFDTFEEVLTNLTLNFEVNTFFFTFSSAFQFIEKKKINITQNQIENFKKLFPNDSITHWDSLTLARIILLLYIPKDNFESFYKTFNMLFDTADSQEQIALYSSFSYLPFKEKLASKFALGISTNISLVFDALAFNNSFPVNYLSENAWNQLVIKTIFNDKNSTQIIGLKTRINPELKRMVLDLQQERKAANRPIKSDISIFLNH